MDIEEPGGSPIPVFRRVDGRLERIPGDVRDPRRRYSQVCGAEGSYFVEFTEAEERARDAEEAQWIADRPKREAAAAKVKADQAAYRESLVYEDRIVAFIDILGWSASVHASASDAERVKSLGLALSLIRNQGQMVGWLDNQRVDGVWPGDPQFTHFSDCIAFSVLDDRDGPAQLLSTLSFLASALLQQGYLLRGGIAYGRLYHRMSTVFGPALIRAFELESEVAVFPRIILDPPLAVRWGQGLTYQEGKEVYTAKTWRLDGDGYRFFDFLQPFAGGPLSRSVHLYKQTLVPLRSLLESRGQGKVRDPAIRLKYGWLASYFNKVCGETHDHGLKQISERPFRVFWWERALLAIKAQLGRWGD